MREYDLLSTVKNATRHVLSEDGSNNPHTTPDLKVKKWRVLGGGNIQADSNPNGARDPLGSAALNPSEQAEQFHQYC